MKNIKQQTVWLIAIITAIAFLGCGENGRPEPVPDSVILQPDVVTITNQNPTRTIEVVGSGGALSLENYDEFAPYLSVVLEGTTITITGTPPTTDVPPVTGTQLVEVVRAGASATLTININLVSTWEGSVTFTPASPVTINDNYVEVTVGGLGAGALSLGTKTGSAENVTISLDGTTITVTGNRPSSGATRAGARTVEVIRQTAANPVSATLTINYTLTTPAIVLTPNNITIDGTNHTHTVAVTGPATGEISVGSLPEGVRANIIGDSITFFGVHPAITERGGSAITANDVTVAVTRGTYTENVTVSVNLLPPATSTIPGLNIDLVRIPAGTFIMGSPEGEPGRVYIDPSAETQHQVTLTQSFYMMRTTVTRGHIRNFPGLDPAILAMFNSLWTQDSANNNRPATHLSFYWALVLSNMLSLLPGQGINHPAYEIRCATNNDEWTADPQRWGMPPTTSDARWNEVRINPASNGWRLPTEAQWEYACRAGTLTAFNDGVTNDLNLQAVRTMAWVSGPTFADWLDWPTDVATLLPNRWGLWDMHGNVREWCWDLYRDYTADPVTDPTGGTNLTAWRIHRGGSWVDEPHHARSARRRSESPERNMTTNSGVRLVRPAQ